MLRLVGGVGAFDLILLGVGYCLLAPAVGRRSLPSQLTFAGVALLLGAGTVGVVLSALAVAGLPTGPTVFVATATILALAGLLVARSSRSMWLAWPTFRTLRPVNRPRYLPRSAQQPARTVLRPSAA